MGQVMSPDRYYFSVLRWRTDPTRDEARNVGVVLVDNDGRVGGFTAAPISSISPTLHDQGILDGMVLSLQKRIEARELRLGDLKAMRATMQQSLYLTEPQEVAVSDVDVTLRALFKAYAAPQATPRNKLTKGFLLDRVLPALRRKGFDVARGQRVAEVVFDFAVGGKHPRLGSVLTFRAAASDFAGVEKDAGHYLYGLERASRPGLAIIQPPAEDAGPQAFEAHNRVTGWYRQRDVEIESADDYLTATPGAAMHTLALGI